MIKNDKKCLTNLINIHYNTLENDNFICLKEGVK